MSNSRFVCGVLFGTWDVAKTIPRILERATNDGAYVVESEKCKALCYAVKDDEVAIFNGHGYLRMKRKAAQTILYELMGIMDDVEDLKSMGVKI